MRKLSARKWMNTIGHHSTAFIYVAGELVEESDGDDVDCLVSLGDCNRMVSLDFNSWSNGKEGVKQRKNSIKKAQLLADQFQGLADWLREADKEILQRETNKKKKAEKEKEVGKDE